MIRNILWDVDGTLFDTYPAVTYAYSKTLNGMGYSIPLNVIDRLVRTSFNDLVEMLRQRFKLNPYLVHTKFAEPYLNISPANQPPFPGAQEVCEFIHQNNGLNITISHRNPESVHQLLEAHNFSSLVDGIYSPTQGWPEKPDPTMFLMAINKHSLKSCETLCIGDRECDILAGKMAGIRTCQFGKSTSSLVADLQINDYRSLLDFLEKKMKRQS